MSPYADLQEADRPLSVLASPHRGPSISHHMLSPALQMQLRGGSPWADSASPSGSRVSRFGTASQRPQLK
jgi:hypothetical protein